MPLCASDALYNAHFRFIYRHFGGDAIIIEMIAFSYLLWHSVGDIHGQWRLFAVNSEAHAWLLRSRTNDIITEMRHVYDILKYEMCLRLNTHLVCNKAARTRGFGAHAE